MITPSWRRNSERFWRHWANWLWLAPIAWSFIGGTWYAVSKDLAGPGEFAFFPWWVILAGVLAYVTVTITARWGKKSALMLLFTGLLAGSGIFLLSGIHAAIWGSLVIPTLLGSSLLRIPPWTDHGRQGQKIALVVLSLLEPFLVIALILSAVMICIDFLRHSLPGLQWWWITGIGSAILLFGSSWQLRRSRQQARLLSSEDTREPGSTTTRQ